MFLLKPIQIDLIFGIQQGFIPYCINAFLQGDPRIDKSFIKERNSNAGGEIFFFLCPNQCCALLICLPNDLARQLVLYGESRVVFLTHISALKKGWRPKHMCSTQVLHKLYFKSLIGTKWVCRHGAGPLHLGWSNPQCVNSLTDAFEWTPQLPFSGWIFKHIPWRRRTLPLLPHFKKNLPSK